MSGRTTRKKFRRSPEATAEARDYVMSTLINWRLALLADQALLTGDALVVNVIEHAAGDEFEISLRRREGVLVIEVTDALSVEESKVPVAGTDAETGRGLDLVSVCSEKWGVRPCRSGKTVWAHLRI